MSSDTARLVEIASELKQVEDRRARLLSEMQSLLGGERRGPGRPPGRPGRPAGRAVARKPAGARRGRQRRAGLSTSLLDLLKSTGGAFTAGDLVERLNLPKTKNQISSVSTTLVRLVKEGRAKKDKQRGYRAA